MVSKMCNLALIPELLETLEDAIPGRFKNHHCREKEPTCCVVLADAHRDRLCAPMLYPSAIFRIGWRAVRSQSEGQKNRFKKNQANHAYIDTLFILVRYKLLLVGRMIILVHK